MRILGLDLGASETKAQRIELDQGIAIEEYQLPNAVKMVPSDLDLSTKKSDKNTPEAQLDFIVRTESLSGPSYYEVTDENGNALEVLNGVRYLVGEAATSAFGNDVARLKGNMYKTKQYSFYGNFLANLLLYVMKSGEKDITLKVGLTLPPRELKDTEEIKKVTEFLSGNQYFFTLPNKDNIEYSVTIEAGEKDLIVEREGYISLYHFMFNVEKNKLALNKEFIWLQSEDLMIFDLGETTLEFLNVKELNTQKATLDTFRIGAREIRGELHTAIRDSKRFNGRTQTLTEDILNIALKNGEVPIIGTMTRPIIQERNRAKSKVAKEMFKYYESKYLPANPTINSLNLNGYIFLGGGNIKTLGEKFLGNPVLPIEENINVEENYSVGEYFTGHIMQMVGESTGIDPKELLQSQKVFIPQDPIKSNIRGLGKYLIYTHK